MSSQVGTNNSYVKRDHSNHSVKSKSSYTDEVHPFINREGPRNQEHRAAEGVGPQFKIRNHLKDKAK